MNIIKLSLSLFVLAASQVVSGQSNKGELTPTGDIEIDKGIKACKKYDDATSRGTCARNVYVENDWGAIIDTGGKCNTTSDAPRSISNINDCQFEIGKRIRQKLSAPSAIAAAASNRVVTPSPLGDASSFSSELPKKADLATASAASGKVNEASGPNGLGIAAVVSLVALAIVAIALAVFGLMRSLSLTKEVEKAKRIADDSNEKVKEFEGKLSKVGNDLRSTKDHWNRLFAEGAARAIPSEEDRRLNAPEIASSPTLNQRQYSSKDVTQSLSDAVRSFVESRSPFSPSQALEQIFSHMKDVQLTRAMVASGCVHKLVDVDGKVTSYGHLLAISVGDNWLIFPRPHSENVPRFRAWFDGNLSQSSLVVGEPAIAKLEDGVMALKKKGKIA